MNTDLIQSSTEQPINNQPYGVPPALWNPTAAGSWSLLFTPIFGASLVFLNWKTLGVKEKIRGSQIWLVVSIIIFLVQIFLRAPWLAFPYLLIWYFASAKAQAKYVEERWRKEYPKKSWLYPLLFGFAGFLAVFCMAFATGLIRGILSQQ